MSAFERFRQTSAEWRSLEKDQKAVYEKMASDDKKRYKLEKAALEKATNEAGGEVSNEIKARILKPKPPTHAFYHFKNEFRDENQDMNPFDVYK